jgi:hypothetical protein
VLIFMRHKRAGTPMRMLLKKGKKKDEIVYSENARL